MGTPRDRILVVEHDPAASDLIGRQALQSVGYQVQIVGDANSALPRALQFRPDVMIVDLNLPGLSGKDLLVALASQGIEIPVIVIAAKGMEADAIQAFRLGASDYLLWPVRDAEVVSAVERVLTQVHDRRDKQQLARQLQQINQELQARVRELTSIFTVGKAVTSISDLPTLFDRAVDGSVRVTEADFGWILVRDENGRTFTLAAQRNLAAAMGTGALNARLNQPWDDGISTLVAMSGETLAIHGEPIKRFKIAALGQAAMVVPIKQQRQTLALIGVLRKASRPFSPSEQHMLEAIADYASIALGNSRLFNAQEERLRSLQQIAEAAQAGEKAKSDLLSNLSAELRQPLEAARGCLHKLAAETQRGKPDPGQRQALALVLENLDKMSKVVELVAPLAQANLSRQAPPTSLNDLVRQVMPRYQRLAQQNGLSLVTELPADPIFARADPAQVLEVMEGLLSNAIKYSLPGGQIAVRVDRSGETQAHVVIRDTGLGIESRDLEHVFDRAFQRVDSHTNRPGGSGISLALIKEIVSAYGGNIWVESKLGQGSAFHFTLLSPK
jgi:signal transduction histidine kinase/FixJ family two-component response regulator